MANTGFKNAYYVVLFLFLYLSVEAYSQNDMFLTKHKGHIETYIMTGHAWGWKHCDVIHDISVLQQPIESYVTPIFVMDIERLHTFDIQYTFSKSTCLLLSAHVKNNQSLSDLIKFGWSVVQRKRLALVLKLSQGMTLNMATNTTKLPFLVAAELEEKEQFICPVIGESNPRIQDSKCHLSYTSYMDKTLRVGIFGEPPYFIGRSFICSLYKHIF